MCEQNPKVTKSRVEPVPCPVLMICWDKPYDLTATLSVYNLLHIVSIYSYKPQQRATLLSNYIITEPTKSFDFLLFKIFKHVFQILLTFQKDYSQHLKK